MADRIEGFFGHFPLPDLAATGRLAARIAAGLRAGSSVALKGELGAGKTTLARAILRDLGVTEHVPSPTFTLVQSYETAKGPVFHFDLYRIEEALVEWPERAEGLLPEDILNVTLELNAERSATISGAAYWKTYLAKEEDHV